MVIRNTLGYVLGGLGVVGIAAWAIPNFKQAIPQLGPFSDSILIAVSAILVLVGIFLVMKGGSRKVKEVPIYQGKDIVGYRRH
jgi:multisubunit Na+/H+ antiporter MnhB subunit